ncbi:MAG TPA: DUF4350 domain-containing protein [Candidatus Binatia bacterium]|nr:DUF4350 domain-containing protein [Candidatus Binatia bacterium]
MRRPALAPVAILVAVLAVLVVAVILAGPVSSGDQDPSSTADGRAGTLALYEWLQDLGYGVHRIESAYDLGGSDVVISAAPLDVNPFSQGDGTALRRFLESGGDAIIALSDPTTVGAVLQPLGIETSASAATSAGPSQPFPGSEGIGSVPLQPPGGGDVWSFAGEPDLVPLLGSGKAPVAAEVRVGSGRLFLLGSEFPLSNDGLRRGDSAAFVLSLLEAARGESIGFDEVHHLPPIGGEDYGLSAVVQGPLLAAVLLAVAVVLLLLLTGGRRLGRPLPRRDPVQVPSAMEHVSAVGDLLSRSRERGGVASRYAEELKQRIGRSAGVDPHLPDPAFVASLQGYGEERALQVSQLLGDARRLAARRPDERGLVDLARRVDSLETSWGATAIR